MKTICHALAGLLVAIVLVCGCDGAALGQIPAQPPADDTVLSSAICPIVYPLDQSPSERGYHYTFYGNGFFINREGYLLTAAHVLSQLGDVQPYIVLRLPMAPPRLVKATLVAIDREHDVAILRATPNPFEGKYQVRFLPLGVERPAQTQAVLAAALRPSRLRDPHTFDALVEDRPAGEVLQYVFSQLDKGSADTELLLFSHEILLGDSGAPVVSAESQAVVGLVEGRWLHTNAASMTVATRQSGGGVGAAVPIRYAISLLQQQGVAWQAAHENHTKLAPPGSNPEPRTR
jgi:S1-C subfamily serine protease